VAINDWAAATGQVAGNAGAYVAGLFTPSVRLGVTGLSRAGKTVFITALVRNLVSGGRLPFFVAQAQGRIRRAYLEPQPDDAIPRFPYEEHLARLAADPPSWPEGTKRISQLRVTIEYDSQAWLRGTADKLTGGTLGPKKLHVDIVDYPGEWIVDLGLLDLDYDAWSREAIAQARAAHRATAAKAFLAFLDEPATLVGEPEPVAIAGARVFTAYLATARAAEPALSVLTPGRFLMPGDLEGSPLLTFFPLPRETGDVDATPLQALMARRFESYKAQVVKPFFRDHFARLDRQIVLLDALAALNQGPAGLKDLSAAMGTVLHAFRPGANTIASRIFRPRIDRMLFAATKADHLNRLSHDRLEALLRTLADGGITRAEAAGADVRVLAIAALRATREAEARAGDDALPCIIGTPLKGERVGDVTFDGKTETALFPGDLPLDPKAMLNTALPNDAFGAEDIRALTFRPPRITVQTGGGDQPALPHIRLDRAIEFLIGDRLQ
jgi:uncharacterized protein